MTALTAAELLAQQAALTDADRATWLADTLRRNR